MIEPRFPPENPKPPPKSVKECAALIADLREAHIDVLQGRVGTLAEVQRDMLERLGRLEDRKIPLNATKGLQRIWTFGSIAGIFILALYILKLIGVLV